MTVEEAINKRRSIRKFMPGAAVTEEQINALLESAMMAPSACNLRPWVFYAVTEANVLAELSKTHPYTKMLQSAPCAIVVCGGKEAKKGIGADFFPQDCAAATQNILLRAVGLGLGACWCGVYPSMKRVDKVRKSLGIEENGDIPFCIIAVGVPDENPEARGFYDAKKVRRI